MDNNLFRALSSKTRIEIIKRIMSREYHLSQLARELGISKSVISRHIRILEKANLIKRKKIGNVHILIANPEILEKAFEPFVEETKIEASRGETISDILKQFPEIKTKEYKGNQFITSVNGDEGLYIYEIDGEIPEKAIDEYKLERAVLLQLKKLVPVTKKKIRVEIKEED